jgi:hypothetical protein
MKNPEKSTLPQNPFGIYVPPGSSNADLVKLKGGGYVFRRDALTPHPII